MKGFYLFIALTFEVLVGVISFYIFQEFADKTFGTIPYFVSTMLGTVWSIASSLVPLLTYFIVCVFIGIERMMKAWKDQSRFSYQKSLLYFAVPILILVIACEMFMYYDIFDSGGGLYGKKSFNTQALIMSIGLAIAHHFFSFLIASTGYWLFSPKIYDAINKRIDDHYTAEANKGVAGKSERNIDKTHGGA